jgi:hypothetical protein
VKLERVASRYFRNTILLLVEWCSRRGKQVNEVGFAEITATEMTVPDNFGRVRSQLSGHWDSGGDRAEEKST